VFPFLTPDFIILNLKNGALKAKEKILSITFPIKKFK